MALGSIGLATHIWNNNLKSAALLAGFPFLLVLMLWGGALLAAALMNAEGIATPVEPFAFAWQVTQDYAVFALLGAALWMLVAYCFHQSIINRATGAKPVSRAEQPQLYNLLENLCISRGVPTPKLYIIEHPAMNAYASGITRENYAVTVTTGLLGALDEKELEAVLAHELTHILNNDVRLLVISTVFVGMISFLSEMAWRSMRRGVIRASGRRGKGGGAILLAAGIALGIGYLFSIVIRFTLSRTREYLADAGAAELTKNPGALVSALRKISGHAAMKDVPEDVRQMFIENPPGFFGLFSTHPPIEKRIAALELAGAAPYVSQNPLAAPAAAAVTTAAAQPLPSAAAGFMAEAAESMPAASPPTFTPKALTQPTTLLSVILILVGAIFAAVAGFAFYQDTLYEEKGISTEGEVLSKWTQHDDDSTSYGVRYRYRDHHGKAHTGSGTIGSDQWLDLHEGGGITVQYISDNPGKSRAAQESEYLLFALLCLVGAGLSGGGLWIAIRGLRRRALYDRLRKEGSRVRGKVTAVTNANTTINNVPHFRVEYEYRDYKGQAHTGKSQLIPREAAQRYQPGMAVIVLYDRQEPGRHVAEIA